MLKREYMERVRTKWFVIATLFGPLLFGTLMFLPSYLGSRSKASDDVKRIRILDATGTDLGQLVAYELGGGITGDTATTQVVRTTAEALPNLENRATADVQAKQLKGYLVLPSNVLSSGSARYAGVNATAIADMEFLRNVVERQVLTARLQAAGLSADAAAQISKGRFQLKSDRITDSGKGGSGRVSLLFAISVAMLLYMTILMYGQNVLRSVIEEKTTRVAEVIVASVRPATLLAGKVLGVGAVGITQMLIWVAASFLMGRYRVSVLNLLGIAAAPLQLPEIGFGMTAVLLLYFLLGYILYSALFAAVGSMTSSEVEAQQAQLPVILLLVAGIMFLQPVLNAPDGRLAQMLAWIPFTAPIMMPLRMSAVDVAEWDVTLSLVTLVAACYLAVFIAARIYRTGILMYGKRASIGEVMQWLKRAG